ncbi:unnamed protein product [Cylicostephanus goldi]|uniref:Uncharacterized protein n=1 Tax=Cylicostephanus goldi TaxID=71465 RepID=A0A3P6SBV6_CYLGO|nr:unnamed protein product [Cylicostephanus goldi]
MGPAIDIEYQCPYLEGYDGAVVIPGYDIEDLRRPRSDHYVSNCKK